jgi:hypothetical protein
MFRMRWWGIREGERCGWADGLDVLPLKTRGYVIFDTELEFCLPRRYETNIPFIKLDHLIGLGHS